MAFVINKESGERQRVISTDLDMVIKSGLASIDPDQTILMQDGEGNIVETPGSEYEESVGRGGRTLTENEVYNLIENQRKEFKYTSPRQKSQAIAEGAVRGLDLGASEFLRGLAGHDRGDMRARQYFNPYSAGTAEVAGSILGAGKLKLFLKAGGAALQAGKGGALGYALAKPVSAGLPLPSALASNVAEAAMKSGFAKGIAGRGMAKDASRLMKTLGPAAPIAIQGAVDA